MAQEVRHVQREFPHSLEKIWNHPDLSNEAKQQMIYSNAKKLYGL
jgi:hypothetical protein